MPGLNRQLQPARGKAGRPHGAIYRRQSNSVRSGSSGHARENRSGCKVKVAETLEPGLNLSAPLFPQGNRNKTSVRLHRKRTTALNHHSRRRRNCFRFRDSLYRSVETRFAPVPLRARGVHDPDAPSRMHLSPALRHPSPQRVLINVVETNRNSLQNSAKTRPEMRLRLSCAGHFRCRPSWAASLVEP